jgi:hypothetical protein
MLYRKSAMLGAEPEDWRFLKASRQENANDEEVPAVRDFHGGERDLGEFP